MASSCRWYAPDLADCRWASWEDGEYFLFNPATGKTHLLNELGKALLQGMAEAPRSSEELSAALCEPGDDTPMNLTALIEDQLRQLRLIGLVETVS